MTGKHFPLLLQSFDRVIILQCCNVFLESEIYTVTSDFDFDGSPLKLSFEIGGGQTHLPSPPYFIALCQVASTLDSLYSLKMPSAKVAAKKKADDKAKAKLGVKKTVKTKKVSKKAEKEKTKKPSGAKPKSAPKKKVTKGGKKK